MKIEVLACDFCHKTAHQVEILIAGPRTLICNECVDLCNEIIAEDRQARAEEAGKSTCGP